MYEPFGGCFCFWRNPGCLRFAASGSGVSFPSSSVTGGVFRQLVLWFLFVIPEYRGCFVQYLTGFDRSSRSGHPFCQFRDPSHALLDFVQGFVHLFVDFLVGGLDKCQCLGGQSEVAR